MKVTNHPLSRDRFVSGLRRPKRGFGVLGLRQAAAQGPGPRGQLLASGHLFGKVLWFLVFLCKNCEPTFEVGLKI